MLEDVLTLLIEAEEQLLDAFVGEEVVEDLDDQLELLVEELRSEESSQIGEVLGLP